MAVPMLEARPAPARRPRRPAAQRLAVPMPPDVVVGWLGPLGVMLFAFLLRLHRLAIPAREAFDEVYYNCDSYTLLRFGYERAHGEGCAVESGAAYVVHPPLGKWMIALGEQAFGYDSFGWRISAAVFGALSVLVVCRIGRRLFRSTLLGCVAGGLLALDGLHFVQSRMAMLDIFLMFWVVAAFGCLLVDRDDARRRLAARLQGAPARRPSPLWRWWGVLLLLGGTAAAAAWAAARLRSPGGLLPAAGAVGVAAVLMALAIVLAMTRFDEADDLVHPGPYTGVRWWRIAAGVCLGAACAVKWSGVWYVAAFLLLAFAWEVGARRTAGVSRPARSAAWREGVPLVTALLVLAGVVYVASWSGWFATEGGWRRTCAEDAEWRTDHPERCGPIKGFIGYHQQVWEFHQGLSSPHTYESGPWSWLLLGRPVSYFYSSPEPGTSKEILAIGTPAIWWASIPALGFVLWRWVSRRDWRAAAVLVGFAAGYLPWFLEPNRTMFLFYALPALPFMCLALAYSAGVVLGPRDAPRGRRTTGALAVGGYLTLVVLNFVYLYPILAAKVIPYEEWRDRMWIGSWI